MKKLLTTMSAVAAAMSLFAADTGALSGTSFEGLAAADQDPYNITAPEGEITGTGGFWRTNGTDTLTVKAGESVAPAQTDLRPKAFQGTANANYLSIKTASLNESISRRVNADGSAVSIDGGTETTKGLYFDSYVRFTAFDGDQTIDLGEGGKLAIWLKEEELDGGSTSTNLMITAGYLDSSLQARVVTTNYNCEVVGGINFNDGGWHRVTVKAIDSIYASGSATPGFVVFVDKSYVRTTDTTTMGISGTLTGTASEWNRLKALFPSACQNGTAVGSITAVDFAGQGDVDELVFTRTAPFDDAQDIGLFTIVVPVTGVERVTFTTNNVDVVITETTTLAITDALSRYGIKISAKYSDGYMGDTWEGLAIDGGSYYPQNDGDYVGIVTKRAGAYVGNTPFPTLAAAVAHVNDTTECPAGSGTYTIRLAANASGNVDITNAGITNILDLAGYTFTGTSTADAAIKVTAGALTIKDTVGGGIVQGAIDNDGALVAAVDCGTATIAIEGGTYRGNVNATAKSISGGSFLMTHQYEEEGEPVVQTVNEKETLDPMIIDGYEATNNGSTLYWAVTEKSTTYTVKFISGEGSTTNEYTEITAGTEQTVPTPANVEGKSFSAWDPAIAGATVTVNADATYTALYTNNIYTITFVIGENSSSVQKEYGSEITSVPEIPVRPGYTGAWDDDPAGDTVTGDKTYTYTYSAETYTITYMFGANELTGLTPATYTVEDAVTLTNEVDLGVMGVAFEAWTNAEGTVVAGWAAGAKTGNQTFYAKTGAVVQEPTVDGNPVTPAEVFTVADSESPIVYPSAPTLSGEVGSQTITFGGTTVDVPAYYTASLSDNTVSLALNDNAIPTIGATVASGIPAMEVGSSTVSVGLTSTNTKLYYGLAKSSTVGGTYAAPATLTQGTGEAMALTVDKTGGATAEFYKIYVTDIAPAQN